MVTTHRRTDPPLMEQLHSEAGSFQFFQAVRLLERIYSSRASVGRDNDPKEETVRFASHISLNFPPSEINKIIFPDPESAEKAAQMTVSFMGLAGPVGMLPNYYTEMLIDRRRNKDHTMADFLDIFNHRLISLFYRAWKKYRFAVNYERSSEDILTEYLFNLIGMGTRGLRGRLSVPDKGLLLYAGLIAQRPHSASAMASILSDYLQIPVTIVPFAGQWLKLSTTDFTRIGRANNRLGVNTIVGERVWDQQSKYRVRFGPLTFKKFSALLPVGTAHRAAIDLNRYLAGQEYDFDMQLVLSAAEVPACRVTNDKQNGMLLGWTTWLKTKPFCHDDEQVVLSGEKS